MAFEASAVLPVTSQLIATLERPPRRRPARFWLALGCALAVHAVPIVLMLVKLTSPAPVSFVEPSIAVELVALKAPPAPPSEQPDGPKQVQAAASKLTPKTIEKTPPPVPSDVEPLPIPPQTPQVQPTVDSTPAPETTAPAAKPAPPAQSASAAPQTWQARLLAHLEKNKRYPATAQRQRQQGTVWLRFTMDRNGRVVSARVERGSGAPALDQAALDMLKRAQPLPKPPAEVTGDPIELTVPVEFFMKTNGR